MLRQQCRKMRQMIANADIARRAVDIVIEGYSRIEQSMNLVEERSTPAEFADYKSRRGQSDIHNSARDSGTGLRTESSAQTQRLGRRLITCVMAQAIKPTSPIRLLLDALPLRGKVLLASYSGLAHFREFRRAAQLGEEWVCIHHWIRAVVPLDCFRE